MDDIQQRIRECEKQAKLAKRQGDQERYWQARRDLLLAQAEFAKRSQRYGELPY